MNCPVFGEAYIHFNSNQNDGYSPANYKTERIPEIQPNFTDFQFQQGEDPPVHTFNFVDKTINLVFGPLDTHVLRFNGDENFTEGFNNGWEEVWSNHGNGYIANVEISSDHEVITGNFIASNGNAEEVLAIQKYDYSAWASLVSYDHNAKEWLYEWSNGGNGHLKSVPGGVGLNSETRFFSGNFFGNDRDELLTINSFENDHWITVVQFNENSPDGWIWKWSNYGSTYFEGSNLLWPYDPSDKIIICDFDGDGYDEIFIAQESNSAQCAILKFDQIQQKWIEQYDYPQALTNLVDW